MARLTKEERHREIHAEAMSNFDRVQMAYSTEREQCIEDRRFYSIAGAQWEGPLALLYENKPKLEVNKIHLAIIRIINEYRNNRISVKFVSKDGVENEFASVLEGLFRADEQDSVANEAYDNAFEESVGGGIGAWRLINVLEDESDLDNDYQRIRIEPIYDADVSVYFDVDAYRQDKSDAKYCFVVKPISIEAYKEEWGDDPVTWPRMVTTRIFDWCSNDSVYIAEYYRVEKRNGTMFEYVDISGEKEIYYDTDFEQDDTLQQELEAIGSKVASERKYKKTIVHKYILSGGGILSEEVIAGSNIPIVPTFGKRWIVDGIERCMGHVRLSKDAQRLKNMQLSKLAEISALSSIEKPILLPEQVAGHQLMWSEDNIKNYPYLLVNPMYDLNGSPTISGPLAYTRSPTIPPAMAALLQLTESDMQEILGSNQQADKMVSNISGKAVELIQQRIDMQAFIYMSNFAKAMRRCGEIWLSMAKQIYVDKGRKMKVVSSEQETSSLELVSPKKDDETGEVIYENNLSKARFDVNVEVGPSSKSKKDATVRAITEMMTFTDDPTSKQVLQSMAIMNMEGEGIEDMRKYFRKKMVMLGVVQPTEEEKQMLEQAQQQEDPNQVFMQAAAMETQAKAEKAKADTMKSMSEIELNKAKTMDLLADIQGKQNLNNDVLINEEDQIKKIFD